HPGADPPDRVEDDVEAAAPEPLPGAARLPRLNRARSECPEWYLTVERDLPHFSRGVPGRPAGPNWSRLRGPGSARYGGGHPRGGRHRPGAELDQDAPPRRGERLAGGDPGPLVATQPEPLGEVDPEHEAEEQPDHRHHEEADQPQHGTEQQAAARDAV